MEWCPIATIVFKSDEITAVPVYAVKTIFWRYVCFRTDNYWWNVYSYWFNKIK
jgi:hypothetical protein